MRWDETRYACQPFWLSVCSSLLYHCMHISLNRTSIIKIHNLISYLQGEGWFWIINGASGFTGQHQKPDDKGLKFYKICLYSLFESWQNWFRVCCTNPTFAIQIFINTNNTNRGHTVEWKEHKYILIYFNINNNCLSTHMSTEFHFYRINSKGFVRQQR